MNEHDRTCRLADHVVPWRLGELDSTASAEFEDHLDACEVCRNELEELGEVVAAVESAAPEVEPPPRILDELRRRIRTAPRRPALQPWRSWPAEPIPQAAPAIQRAGDDDWEPTAIEGIRVRRLHADPARDRVTMLVRMEPGTAWPGHVHAGPEECYVLEGDLTVGDEVMHAGDYQHAPEGFRHGAQSTEGGCLLLISSSMSDVHG